MKNLRLKTYIFLLVISAINLHGQQFRTSYFMDRMPLRHQFNPALINDYGYISFPFLGGISAGVSSNVGLSNFVYPTGNEALLFLNKGVDSNKFLSSLYPMNSVQMSIDLPIISFGFFGMGGYNTFDLSLRTKADVGIPKTLFEFMKVGMSSNSPQTIYDIDDYSVTADLFGELSMGHAREINDRLTIGVKAKLLVGIANLQGSFKDTRIEMSGEKWVIQSNSEIIMGGPFSFTSDERGILSGLKIDESDLRPKGYGGAIDLGATYRLLPQLTLSMSVTDLGAIWWEGSKRAESRGEKIEFSGFDLSESDQSIDEQTKELGEKLTNMYLLYPDAETNSHTSRLRPTLTFGGEYDFLDRRISIGLLSTNRFGGAIKSWNEAMLIGTFRPVKWLNIALSGSISQTGGSAGCALNICPRGFNLFVGGDYLLVKLSPQFYPIDRSALNINFGISIPIGPTRDKVTARRAEKKQKRETARANKQTPSSSENSSLETK